MRGNLFRTRFGFAVAVAMLAAGFAMPRAAGAGVTAAGGIRFDNYVAPDSFGNAHQAGETSIGVNPHTNNAIFLMNTDAAPAPTHSYPHAIYYCAQDGVYLSQCTRSDDGAMTWGPPIPMDLAECDSLHGHIVVTHRGIVLIPPHDCYGLPPAATGSQGL